MNDDTKVFFGKEDENTTTPRVKMNEEDKALKAIEARLFKIENFSDGEKERVLNHILNLEARIAELEAQALEKPMPENPEEPKKVRPRAGVGCWYFYMNEDGKCDEKIDNYYPSDLHRYRVGNYHLTKEACQAYCDETNAKALALQRIKDWIVVNGYEFEPDWKNEGQEKYAPHYNHPAGEWVKWVISTMQ